MSVDGVAQFAGSYNSLPDKEKVIFSEVWPSLRLYGKTLN